MKHAGFAESPMSAMTPLRVAVLAFDGTRLLHLAEPLALDRLAGAAHMSRRSCTRHFREATAMTVSQWLNTQRVAHAQQLLSTQFSRERRGEVEGGPGGPDPDRHVPFST